MNDPAEFLLEELELGDARMAEYRGELLACMAIAVEYAASVGADALAGDTKEERLRAIEALDLGELPDLLACLESIVARSLEAGQRRGRELADRLGPKPDTFDEIAIPRRPGMEIAERLAVLPLSWRDVLRQSLRDRIVPVLRGIVDLDAPSSTMEEVLRALRGISIQLTPREQVERNESAGDPNAPAPTETVAAPHVIPDGSKAERVREWVTREVQRQAEALRSTTVEQAVIATDVESNELGKIDAVAGDVRVRAFRFVAVLDDRTTCLCGGLHHFTMLVKDERRIEYMPPLHINCRSSIQFLDIPEDEVNFDEVRDVTVNDRVGGKIVRVTYNVAPSQIRPSALGGTSPPPQQLIEVIAA